MPDLTDPILKNALERDTALRSGRAVYRLSTKRGTVVTLPNGRRLGDPLPESGTVAWSGLRWRRESGADAVIGDGSADAIRTSGELRAEKPTAWTPLTVRPHGPGFVLGGGAASLRNLFIVRRSGRCTITGGYERGAVQISGPDRTPFQPDRIAYQVPHSLDIVFELRGYRSAGTISVPHQISATSGFLKNGVWAEVDGKSTIELSSLTFDPPSPASLTPDYLDLSVHVTDARLGPAVGYTNAELRAAAQGGTFTSEALLELTRAKLKRGDTEHARFERIAASARKPSPGTIGPMPYILGGGVAILLVAEWVRRRRTR